MRRIIFDIETVPFSDEFKNARSQEKRLEFAPRMRVACALDVRLRSLRVAREDAGSRSVHCIIDLSDRNVLKAGGRYHYFTPAQSRELIDLLMGADQIVSFNGKRFDLLVLRRHHGLTAKAFATLNRKRRHIDLWEIFTDRCERRVSLDAMARLNLGEGKMVSGRDMAELSLKELKRACRSDVRQTYRLLKLHEAGKIRLPASREQYRGSRQDDDDGYGPEPHCHLPGSPGDYMPLDTSEMSEGQEAMYLAGMWGVTWSGRLVEM